MSHTNNGSNIVEGIIDMINHFCMFEYQISTLLYYLTVYSFCCNKTCNYIVIYFPRTSCQIVQSLLLLYYFGFLPTIRLWEEETNTRTNSSCCPVLSIHIIILFSVILPNGESSFLFHCAVCGSLHSAQVSWIAIWLFHTEEIGNRSGSVLEKVMQYCQ